MTAQEILDSLLTKPKTASKCVQANNLLTQTDKEELYKVVEDFEAQGMDYDYDSGLIKIASIMKQRNLVNKSGVISNQKAMPYLIKQVLFYMVVACYSKGKMEDTKYYLKDYEGKPFLDGNGGIIYNRKRKPLKTQEEIINYLSSMGGVKLSHNFFSAMKPTPFSWVQSWDYEQPEMLFQYLGRKTDSLGTAIKWLVYQAGAYDVFIDVFGGTGAASVSMPRRNNAAYIYNDIDEGLSNLWDVISDNELYKQLIKDLKDLQLDLEREYTWELGEEIDFSTEIIEYNQNKKVDPLEPINRRIDPFFKDIVEWMKNLHKALDDAGIKDIRFNNRVFGIEMSSDMDLYLSYIKNYDYINEYIIALQGDPNNKFMIPDIHMEYDSRYEIDIPKGYVANTKVKPVKSKLNKANKDEDPIEYVDYIDYIGQLNLSRFFEWYAFFSNLINKKYKCDKSIRAVAEIFVDFVTIRGIRSGNAISNIYVSYEEKWEYLYTYGKFPREYNVWKKFTGVDFNYIISRLHSLIKKNTSKTGTERTIVENKDFRDIIPQYSCLSTNKKIKQNHPLFYVDSPYLNTMGYRTNFGASDMEDLIKALKASRDKFIFSCRACKSSNAGNKNNTLKKDNQSILSGVFGVFEKEFGGSNLYVLTIEPLTKATRKKNVKNSFFKNLVEKNKVAEIMITNYEIHSFDDPNAKFIVYDFREFMRLLNDFIKI